MPHVLILGDHGRIARAVIDRFLTATDAELTLYVHRAADLHPLGLHERVRLIEGDVLDRVALLSAMVGQDVVYAHLADHPATRARAIVEAMTTMGLRRLLFVSETGRRGEISGGIVRPPHSCREAVDVIEASPLHYTILHPARPDNRENAPPEASDGLVSPERIAALIARLATTPDLHVRESLSIHEPT